jgi:hypothetical protein
LREFPPARLGIVRGFIVVFLFGKARGLTIFTERWTLFVIRTMFGLFRGVGEQLVFTQQRARIAPSWPLQLPLPSTKLPFSLPLCELECKPRLSINKSTDDCCGPKVLFKRDRRLPAIVTCKPNLSATVAKNICVFTAKPKS